MKIGVNYWMFKNGLEAKRPIVDAMTEAKRLGFDAIELCIGFSGVLTHNTTYAQCKEIVQQAKLIGIEISSVASEEYWQASPSASDMKVRKQSFDFTKKAMQVTKWLNCDAYRFIPGVVDVFFDPKSEVVPYDICYKRATQVVKMLVPHAEQLGVTICIPNVWNKFLLSPLEMRSFIDSLQSKRVGVYFDVANVLLTGYPDHWIRILGKRIKRIHIKDFKKSVGTAAGFVDLLEGDVDFAVVKKALAAIGGMKNNK